MRGALAAVSISMACSGCGAPSGQGASPSPISSATLELAGPAPTATASMVAEPSVAASVGAPAAAVGPKAECRGGRLRLEDVVEHCRVSEAPNDAVPEEVVAEIAGPGTVKPGETAAYAIQLVNRGQAPVTMTIEISCGWSMSAIDGKGYGVIRIEHSSGAETMLSCSAKAMPVEIVLEPGGVFESDVSWRAYGEHRRDGKLLKSGPLAPGKYELHGTTWLSRGDPARDGNTHGARHAVVGHRTINVAP